MSLEVLRLLMEKGDLKLYAYYLIFYFLFYVAIRSVDYFYTHFTHAGILARRADSHK